MSLVLCGDAGIFDFQVACIRSSWSAILPAIVVLVFCAFAIPVPKSCRKLTSAFAAPFQPFLTIDEAQEIDAKAHGQSYTPETTSTTASPLWRALLFTGLAVVQMLGWAALGSYQLMQQSKSGWEASSPLVIALTWAYAAGRPIKKTILTPPLDLFALYTLHLCTGALLLGGIFFDHTLYAVELPSQLVLVGLSANLVITSILLSVILCMPVGRPTKYTNVDEIGRSVSPEDYTSLFGWMTFNWVYPLIKRSSNGMLNESDVWALSPGMRSRPLLMKFTQISDHSLIRRICIANSSDIIISIIIVLSYSLLEITGPIFLKYILDILQDQDNLHRDRPKAYIYAILAFIASLARAESTLQCLWYSRRAAVRTRSELMASIYEKALKTKAQSSASGNGEQAQDVVPADDNNKIKAENEAENGANLGKIVNLMSGDATRVSEIVCEVLTTVGVPIRIILASVMLFQLLGLSAFAGFSVFLVAYPLGDYLAKKNVDIHKRAMASRDRKMAILDELLLAIKFVKFFAWEERWVKRALDAREVELHWLIKARINTVCYYALWSTVPLLVSTLSFLAYVAQGNELTISVAFTSISLYAMIKQASDVIPSFLIQALQARVSIDRISAYLDEDEVTEQVSTLKKVGTGGDVVESEGLGIENASFRWNEVSQSPQQETKSKSWFTRSDSKQKSGMPAPTSVKEPLDDYVFELKDISIRFPQGKLTVITGPTASGKSALLMALLGEMTQLPGQGRVIMSKDATIVDAHGLAHTISYAAQAPWLRHQSIRENILFGAPYDETRYKAVVECCALKKDFEILEDGDNTEIGSRGVSLSGGQKARVALARAVYARTKYVLLDDPLSAVDSHTARFLFEKLLQGPLMANRTTLLVTHHVELVLPGAHYLVRMLDGRIDTQGTIGDLRSRGVLKAIVHESPLDLDEAEEEPVPVAVTDTPTTDDIKPDENKKPRKLVKDEHREGGVVKWSVYKSYLKASSYWTWVFTALCVIAIQALVIGEKVWFKIWGESYEIGANTSISFASFTPYNSQNVMDLRSHFEHATPAFFSVNVSNHLWPNASQHPYFYMGVYAAIGAANVLFVILSVIAQFSGGLKASRLMFKKLLINVVRAPMRWHDVTPQGRMLNRFSKDIETIDMELPRSLQSVIYFTAALVASVLIITFVFPWFLIPAIAIGFVYRLLAIGYLNTGRDLRRMESNTRSPIFSGFGELLEGIVTVRAFSAEQQLLDELHSKIDLTSQMFYSYWMTNRWLLLNFEVLGALAVLFTTLFSLSGFVDAGIAGLCITSAMSFTVGVYCVCRYWTTLELNLNSVERVVEYLDLPQEPPAIIENSRPPAYWPSGSNNDALITVEDLVVKYAPELPSVLDGVSFSLKAGERVGLLGRTGSGKSTLAMSLLRFADPHSGRIIIDGIDISKIGVQDLRSRLTFIPQDATLFSGTLRDNLDPFGEYTDQECKAVLQRVQVMTPNPSEKSSRTVSRIPSSENIDHMPSSSAISVTQVSVDSEAKITLNTEVSAGGANFSQGQRQLIAMARALLRRSAIVILDEATSSIDFETDAKIQTTIREEFCGSLLLTVAHRLRTVIDYDRLIILDKGGVAEFDTPYNLIEKENSIFRDMCLKSGIFEELHASAKFKAEAC